MSKVIRISEAVFTRLQRLGTPLVDTPASVIERLLDHYDHHSARATESSTAPPLPAPRSARPSATNEPGIYLAPASEENLQATVLRAQPLSVAEPYLDRDQHAVLSTALAGQPAFRCWAMTRNSQAKFEAMNPGDWVLFTTKGSGHFSYSARVLCKLSSRELGRALWSVVPGLPWEPIYFVDQVTRLRVPKERLVTALGYAPKYVVPGIVRVGSDRTAAALARYGSIPGLLSALSAE